MLITKMYCASNNVHYSYYGFWYGDDVADVGNIHYLAYRDNLILELCLSGAWISFVVWIAILVLMLKERHHLKVQFTVAYFNLKQLPCVHIREGFVLNS